MLCAENSSRVKSFQERERENQEEYWAAGALRREEVVLQVVGLLGPGDGRELVQNYIKKDTVIVTL